MGRIDTITGDWQAALAALDWQADLGVDAAVQDTPLNRYEAVTKPEAPAPDAVPDKASASSEGPVAEAVASASRAASLPDLRAALAAYPHCEISLGARNLVFAGGQAGARVMVVGDAPDIDDDRQGTPFAGAKGALLDRMFATIGLARDAADLGQALYLTTVLPWKPPGDRAPDADEVAMIRPFLMQHITLASPGIVVAMGTDAVRALTRDTPLAWGEWGQVMGLPLLAMQHPTALLRTPLQKREAWAGLLALKARLAEVQGAT